MAEPRERPRPLLERFERFIDALIPPPDEIVELVRRGETLLRAGDAPGALRIAASALAAAPGYLPAITLRVDALSLGGEFGEALAVLDSARLERSLPPEVVARMVELAARVGDERRALDLDRETRARLRDRAPTVARRLFEGARALVARGAPAAGLRLARSATLVDPDLGVAWLLLAEDASRRGDRAQARRALDRAEKHLDPADAAAARSAGDIALALGELPRAARQLKRAWIGGDEAAIASLVLVLSRLDDDAGIERVVAGAEGSAASLARSLVAVGRADESARAALAATPSSSVPDALWLFALEMTLRHAADISARWCDETPARPSAAAVSALTQARAKLSAGDPRGARSIIGAAFGDELTDSLARDLWREALTTSWAGQLSDMLDELAAMVRESNSLRAVEDDLRARRRELDDPLRVAILGEFSAGKSTFLNALVGAAVSPMGVLPTTASVHWLRYGEPGARVVDTRGGAVAATIDQAPHIVERKRAAGEAVDYVEVTMPVHRLTNVDLIDTPGFNAGDPAHELAVRRAFDIADVAVWLFDARQAGKFSETGPLTEARDARLPVVGVLNKVDQIREEDRPKLLGLLRDGFRELAPLVRAISAREALQAALALAHADASPDARAAATQTLESSGMAALTQYLDEHLILQRSAWKKARVARRALQIVSAAEHALATEGAERAAAAARLDALGAAVLAARGPLSEAADTVRREVAGLLREQIRGLDDRARKGGAAEASALASDAAGEIAHRARSRALDKLGPLLDELRKLCVATGLVGAEAAELVTAPVATWLEIACALGVRDASTDLVVGPGYLPGDPLAALSRVIERRDDSYERSDPRLPIALEIARRELERFEAPRIESEAGSGGAKGIA